MSASAAPPALARRVSCLELIERVALLCSETSPMERTLERALVTIADFDGWPAGHILWAVPELERCCQPSKIWHLADDPRLERFRRATESMSFRRKEGLPGHTFERGEPTVMRDLDTEDFIRRDAAVAAGLRAGAALPIVVDGGVVAIVELFHRDPRHPDDAFLQVMASIGALLGRVVERDRAAARERKLATQRERRERQLAEAQEIAELGSWTWEVLDDRITWNEMLFRIFGVDAETFPANYESYQSLLHPDDRNYMNEVIQGAMKNKRPYEVTHRIVRPDGTVRHIYSRGSVFTDPEDNVVRLGGTALDITDRIEAERHRQELAVQQARSAALEIRNQELEQFAYAASHDLQEPLRTISGYLQLLERRYAGALDDDARDFIGFAREASVRMQILIEDLLSYSRITTEGRPFETVELEAAIATACENLARLIEESGVELEVEQLPAVHGDRGQLTRLFQNLLSNAIKFAGDRPPRITIAGRADGHSVQVAVRDEGVGFDPRFSDRVFEVFQRVHGREYEGTGIGLAICKKIAQRHSGDISAESAPGEGTTIHLTLPAAR